MSTYSDEPMVETRKRDTKQAIYGAAVRAIYQRGYHGTSLRTIASEAGLQMASLYYHYPSKQDLLMSIMTEGMTALTACVEEALVGTDHPAEKLAVAMRAHLEFHAHRAPEAFIVDDEIRALEPENRNKILKMRDHYEAIFTKIIADGVQQGCFGKVNPKLASYAIISMCAGVAVWYRPNGPLSIDEICREYVYLASTGVLSRMT